MRKFTIGENDAGQRVDRFLSKAMPGLPLSAVQKGIRTKNIKLNGRRCRPEQHLTKGDELSVYVTGAAASAGKPALPGIRRGELNIVYQDAYIMILNKQAGLPTQSAPGTPSQDSLEGRVRAYLADAGEWTPEEESTFAPSVCHRLDRNTMGLVIAAKTAEAQRIISGKIKSGELEKRYLCVVCGHPKPFEGKMEDFLFKDAKRNVVMAKKSPERGAKKAVMTYRTLDIRGDLSLVECTLITGRTHQIRVQMAARGWPLLGDGKYGSNELNAKYGKKTQELCAYKISFRFSTPAGALQYLGGREFSINSKFENFC